MVRPRLVAVVDELGMKKSLPAAAEHFEVGGDLRPDAPVIFLGLGPEPARLPEWFGLEASTSVSFVESQDVIDQIDNWENAVPDTFGRIPAGDFNAQLAAGCRIIRYLPTQKAFPSFFAPLTARTLVRKPSDAARVVWLPVSEDGLLTRELSLAFEAAGYGVRHIDHEALCQRPGVVLPKLLQEEPPTLFFSVNFKGLDPHGLGFHILREAGVQVGVWLVDNPFHLLTAVKSGYWRQARLFVTDHSFIGPLIETGARWAAHLPLAACPELFAEGGELPEHGEDLGDRLVFVGRSEFPKRDKFFAGLTPDASLMETARHMLDNGERPHFLWWRERIQAQLWPGNDVRKVGAGAEASGQAWRTRCLAAAAGHAVIFGDDGWKRMPGVQAEVRSPVDYYAHLPALYRKAAATLNVTGMQLPAGLTQRHFDVWCAGGFLITDANPGLKIFPEELTAPVTFETPDGVALLHERFAQESPERQELQKKWQGHIESHHTYANRVETVLASFGLEGA